MLRKCYLCFRSLSGDHPEICEHERRLSETGNAGICQKPELNCTYRSKNPIGKLTQEDRICGFRCEERDVMI